MKKITTLIVSLLVSMSVYCQIIPGNALELDNFDDYIEVPHQSFLNTGNEITVEGWVMPNDANNFNLIYKYSGSSGFIMGAIVDRLYIRLYNGGNFKSIFAGFIESGRWSHLAFTFTAGDSIYGYINGEQVLSLDVTNDPLDNNSSPLMIGSDGGPGGSLDGNVDEVRIWNYARTQAEIQSKMLDTVNPVSPGLIAYYRFDEFSGSILPDLSGNANDGTLTNMFAAAAWIESYAMVQPGTAPATNNLGDRFTANWTVPAIGVFSSKYFFDLDNDPDFSSPIYDNYELGAVTSLEITGLTYSTDYYYRVRAYSTTNTQQSISSDIMSVTTASMPPPGYALDFDGVDSYVSIPHHSSLKPSNNITIEAWVKADNIETNEYYEIYRKEDGDSRHLLSFQSFGTSLSFGLNIGGSYQELDAAINPSDFIGRWHHVAATYDGSYKRLFLDGIILDSVAASGVISTSGTSNAAIGCFEGTGEYFDGRIDEVRIWDVARTQSEIQSAMSDIIDGSTAGLAACYRFDFQEGSILEDITPNGNNGALINMDVNNDWVKSYAMLSPVPQPATNISGMRFIANWNAPTFGYTPTTYFIDVDNDSDFSSPIYESLETGDVLSIEITDLDYLTTYYYRVRAEKDDLGQSLSSNIIAVTTSNEMLPPGNALDFDGVDDYVSLPAILNPALTELTIETWVNPASLGGSMDVVYSGNGGEIILNIGADSSLFCSIKLANGSWYNATSTKKIPSIGRWQHIALSWIKGNSLNIFLDGLQVATTVVPDFFIWDAGGGYVPTIGSYNQGTDKDYHGRIDELRFWNVSRSEAELQADMNDTIDSNTPGLLAYYRFDQLAGTSILTDVSPNAKNGTLTNMDIASDWVESYALLKPENPSAVDLMETRFSAVWKAPLIGGTPTAYYVDVDDDPDFSSPLYDNFDVGDVLKYEFEVASFGTYYFRVRAEKNTLGQSQNSIIATVEIPDFDRPGYCIAFEGSTDDVTIPYSAEINPLSFTYELWVKPNQNYGNPMGCYSNDDKGFYFSILGPNSYGFYFGNGNYYYSNIGNGLKKFHWVHLAATRDEATDTVKFYVNGILKSSRTGTFVPNDFQDLGIGSDNFFSFDGNVDEVRIWNYPRTEAEINSSMNDTVDSGSSGLVAYYRFDQDLSETLFDLSGNHHGELYYIMDSSEVWIESYALLRPVNLNLNTVTPHTIQWDWQPPEFGNEPTAYYVDLDDDIDFSDPVTIDYNIGLNTSYEATGLLPNTTYYFRVCAYGTDTTEYSQSTSIDSVKTIGISNPGYALTFDGIDDYVENPDIMQASDIERTVEAWVNPEIITDTMAVFVNGDDGHLHLFILPDSTILFEVELNDWTWYTVISDKKVIPGRWQHIAAVWTQNASMTIYLDGQETGSIPVPDFALRDPGNGYYSSIGALGGYGVYEHYFIGKIDEVRIWETTRTQQELTSFMNDTIYRNTPLLLAYYRFDQQNTGRLYDISDFGAFWDERNGTLRNMDTISSWVESYALLTPIADSATEITSNGFTANWQAPPFGGIPTTYFLDVDNDADFSSPILGYDDLNVGDTLAYAVTGLTDNSIYHYRVRAYKDGVTGQSQASDTMTVITSDSLGILVVSINNPSCCLSNDGSITIEAINGTPPYSFLWSDFQTTPTASTLTCMSYTAWVEDATGDTAAVSITLTAETPTYYETIDLCYGDSILLDSTWQNASGTFTDTLTDISGCDSIVETSLTVLSEIVISVVITEEDLGNDGEIDLTVTGGITPYSYEWSNGETTEDLTGLVAGIYEVTVTDSAGCEVFGIYSINSNPCEFPISISGTNVLCSGDSTGVATVVANGNPPYSYLWSNGDTTATNTGLSAGTYFVTVIEDICPTPMVDWIEISEPAPITIDSIVYEDIACYGDSTEICAYVSGGTPIFYYEWTSSFTISQNSCTGIIPHGWYSFFVEDNNGCLLDTMVIINQPPELIVDVVNDTVYCEGYCDGQLNANIFGGQPPYSVIWSNLQDTSTIESLCAGTYNVTITDDNNCQTNSTAEVAELPYFEILDILISPASCGNNNACAEVIINADTVDFGIEWGFPGGNSFLQCGLAPGYYTITVYDPQYCTVDTTFIIDNLASPVIDSLIITDASCNGYFDGSAIVYYSESDPPAGPYVVSWLDSLANPILTGSDSITDLCAGPYTVSVSDTNQCVSTINFSITQPVAPIITFDITHLSSGVLYGAIDMTVTGGIPPFSYYWSNGETTEDIIDLDIGWYYVDVTDTNGCVISDSAYVDATPGFDSENKKDGKFVIFPNPNSGSFKLLTDIIGVFSIEISDLTGKTIYLENLQSSEHFTKDFDLRSFPKGVYLLKLTANEYIRLEKVVIR